MKLPPARLAEFLRKPPPSSAPCCSRAGYRPRPQHADRATAAICRDLKDPFRIAELSGPALAADPARLSDEVASLSLIGGRRVIRIRDTGDSLTSLLAAVLASSKGDSLLVIEGGDLAARSSLRKLCEAARDVAASPCYADSSRDVADIVRDTLRTHEVTASGEAVAYLVAHLGSDRLVTQSELEKLALYAGKGGRIELADAVACVGDSTALTRRRDLCRGRRRCRTAQIPLLRCLQEGQSAVGILRAMMRHFQRLHLSAARMPPAPRPMTRCGRSARRSSSSSRTASRRSSPHGRHAAPPPLSTSRLVPSSTASAPCCRKRRCCARPLLDRPRRAPAGPSGELVRRRVIEPAQHVVELLQRLIMNGKGPAPPREVDGDPEAEQIRKVAFERSRIGVFRRRDATIAGLCRLGQELGLPDIEAAPHHLVGGSDGSSR